MTDRTPMTLLGHKRLKEQLDRMIGVERPRISKAIGVAREEGDLSENAEYHAAKDAQGVLEARIRILETHLATANVIDPTTIVSEKIYFGATVKVQDLLTDDISAYQIVGEMEADLDNGKISIKSPIARGLIGKVVGDLVDIEVPGGTKSLEILEIVYR